MKRKINHDYDSGSVQMAVLVLIKVETVCRSLEMVKSKTVVSEIWPGYFKYMMKVESKLAITTP